MLQVKDISDSLRAFEGRGRFNWIHTKGGTWMQIGSG
jgi:hypothetical protein